MLRASACTSQRRAAVANPEHQGVELGLHAGRERLPKNSLRRLGHPSRRVDAEHVVFEAPHHIALEDARRRVVRRARLRFAAPNQRRDQLLFLSPATGILLVAQSIDADVFQRIGQRADETLVPGHRKIRVANVIGLVKQQPEAQRRSFGIVERQRGEPDDAAIGARLCAADPNFHAPFSAEHRPQDVERALNRNLAS